VYQTFINVFARIRGAFTRWVGAARAWATQQAAHALAVLNRLRWLITVEIPRRLGSLAASIQAWTRARLAELGNVLRAEATRLRDWALGQLRGLLSALTQVRDFLIGRLNELKADYLRIRDRVTSLLFEPGRLVAWIFAPLVAALLRYLLDNLDQWADYFWQRRANVERQALATAERVLDRIL